METRHLFWSLNRGPDANKTIKLQLIFFPIVKLLPGVLIMILRF